jgi:hypothetical protein
MNFLPHWLQKYTQPIGGTMTPKRTERVMAKTARRRGRLFQCSCDPQFGHCTSSMRPNSLSSSDRNSPPATSFDELSILFIFFGYLDFDATQGGRIMPRVPNMMFVYHESGYALGVKARAKHVGLPRLTESRCSSQQIWNPPCTLERAKGIEPSTYSLGSCRSTTELRPRSRTL